jgi:hypothetical protein
MNGYVRDMVVEARAREAERGSLRAGFDGVGLFFIDWRTQYGLMFLANRGEEFPLVEADHRNPANLVKAAQLFFCKSSQGGFGGGFQTVVVLLVRGGF